MRAPSIHGSPQHPQGPMAEPWPARLLVVPSMPGAQGRTGQYLLLGRLRPPLSSHGRLNFACGFHSRSRLALKAAGLGG